MLRDHTRLTFHPLTRGIWIGLEGESGGQGGLGDPAQAEPAASGQEVTATPDAVKKEPEQEIEEKQEKTFTQAELDAIITKRLAKAERQWKRETGTQQQPASTEAPKPEQFETWEEYAEGLAEYKAQEKVQQKELQKQQQVIEASWNDRLEDAREKYEDFDRVALRQDGSLTITSYMAEAIKDSEIGPDIAYHLGSNSKEADRIAQLSPLQQAREIGKIEAKLIANPPVVKKTSSVPDPIDPLKSHNGSPTSFDTTDPRSIKALSVSEWIEADRARQRRNFKARQG